MPLPWEFVPHGPRICKKESCFYVVAWLTIDSEINGHLLIVQKMMKSKKFRRKRKYIKDRNNIAFGFKRRIRKGL